MKTKRSVARLRAVFGSIIVALVVSSALLAVPASAARTSGSGKCPDPSGTLKIGMSYSASVAAQANATVGLSGELAPTDRATESAYKAGAAALNAAGGVAGCNVEVVMFPFSVGGADFNQLSQAECATFTQDNHVAVVFAAGYETKVAVDCFVKAKLPVFFTPAAALYEPSCADSNKNNLYAVASILTCRFGSFIKLWNDAGLFPKGAKVGILQFDSIDGEHQNQALVKSQYEPKLKKLGYTVETFTTTRSVGAGASGFGDQSAQVAQAVLRFKTDGVNVVLFTPPGAQMLASFMPQALSQQYFPNYGFTSSDAISAARLIGQNAMKKAIAVSWGIIDQSMPAQRALPANPAVKACAPWSVPSESGPVPTLTGANDYCDFFHAIQTGWRGATKLNAATLRKGITALGKSFDSAQTYDGATRFAAKKLDGGSKAMVLTWDPPTKEFIPITGKKVTIP
jgi:hypothetical protein